MKKIVKKLVLACCFVAFGMSTATAQKADKKVQTTFVEQLSPAQKVQYKNLKELPKQNLKDLRATYSKKQREILNNKDLSRYERQKSIRTTLSKSQKSLIKEQHATLKNKRASFRASLTDQQKKQYVSDRVNHLKKRKRYKNYKGKGKGKKK